VTPQKTEDLNYTAEETRNHTELLISDVSNERSGFIFKVQIVLEQFFYDTSAEDGGRFLRNVGNQ
jgi:hypothetical protein